MSEETLFAEALAHCDAAARAAFLEQACGGDVGADAGLVEESA